MTPSAGENGEEDDGATGPPASSVDPWGTMLPAKPGDEPDPLATIVPAEGDAGAVSPGVADQSGGVKAPMWGGESRRFVAESLHARGGLGQVSRGVDRQLGRLVAVKELQAFLADHPDARARFIREAELTGRLEHPGVVPVYGCGVSADGRPYYAMRFIEGRSLDQAIEEHEQARGDAERRDRGLRELVRRLIDVCNTMHYAHCHRVIHRDLKPANVMLGPFGETLVVDWGLARQLDEPESNPPRDTATEAQPASNGANTDAGGTEVEGARSAPSGSAARRDTRRRNSGETIDGETLGTPHYMSPEQAAARWDEVGPRSDIYSLGATLYHVLTGRPPYEAPNSREVLALVLAGRLRRPRELRRSIPAALESICLKALAHDRAARYATARELGEDLQRWLDSAPIGAHREGLIERWTRRLRRHRAWALGVASVLPALVVVLAVAAVLVNGQRVQALKQRDIAKTNERTAQREERRATRAAADAERSLARLEIGNGARLQEAGDFARAGLWYCDALPRIHQYLAEEEPAHRVRLGLLARRLPSLVRSSPLSNELARGVVTQTLSPDGRRAAFHGALPRVVVVDTSDASQIVPPLLHGSLVAECRFSNDGTRLVTWDFAGHVRLWDLEQGVMIGEPQTLAGPMGSASASAGGAVVISPDARRLAAVVTRDGRSLVDVLDLFEGRRHFEPLTFESEVASLMFRPDGEELLIATSQGCEFRSSLMGEAIPREHPIVAPDLWCAQYDPTGSWVATASQLGHAELWDAASGQRLGDRLPHNGPVTGVVFSPNGDVLATMGVDKLTRLWAVPSGRPVGDPLSHAERPWQARFRADGRALVTLTIEDTVQCWDALTGRPLAAPWSHDAAPDVRFVGSDVVIAARRCCSTWRAGEQGYVHVECAARPLDLRYLDNGELAVFETDGVRLVGPSGAARPWLQVAGCVAWDVSPDSHQVAVADAAGRVTTASVNPNQADAVWVGDADTKLGDWRMRMYHKAWHAPVDSRLRVPSGKTRPNRRRAWGVATDVTSAQAAPRPALLRRQPSPEWHDRRGRSNWGVPPLTVDSQLPVALVPTAPIVHAGVSLLRIGSQGEVLTADEQGVARLWPAERRVPVELPHDTALTSADFSADSKLLATGTAAGLVHIWNAVTGQPHAAPWRLADPRLAQPISIVRFHPDGRHLLAASALGEVVIRDLLDSETPPVTLKFNGGVLKAQFSRDGRRVALAGYDNSAQVWNWSAPDSPGAALASELVTLDAQFAGEGQLVVTGGFGGVRVWDGARAEHIGPRLAPRATQLAVSLDGQHVAVWSDSLSILDIGPDMRSVEELRRLFEEVAGVRDQGSGIRDQGETEVVTHEASSR